MSRPYVSVDPAQRFGRPVINRSGISVDAVAESYWTGDDPTAIWSLYGLSRADVLVACWYQGMWGGKEWRKRWEQWALENSTQLAKGDYEAIPDPFRRTS